MVGTCTAPRSEWRCDGDLDGKMGDAQRQRQSGVK